MEDLQKANQGKATYKTYIQAINRYLIPFLGNHNVDRIDGGVLHEFDKWRIVEMGKVPSASVINNHNSALNRVFDEAMERGYMSKHQVPMLRNDGVKSEKRPPLPLMNTPRCIEGLACGSRMLERAMRHCSETSFVTTY